MAAADLISGALAGFSQIVIGQPFDTVKVRLQTNSHYNGTLCCIKSTAFEGLRTFYKGSLPVICAIAPRQAVGFFGFAQGKQIFGNDTLPKLAAAGAWSALYTTPINAPTERVKNLQQVNNFYGKTTNEVLRNLYKEGGFRNVFKGTELTFLRYAFGNSIYFGSYEFLKLNFLRKQNKSKISKQETVISGIFAGVTTWAIVFPVDVVKSKLQAGVDNISRRELWSELIAEIKENGPRQVLYRGIGISVVRTAFTTPLSFLIYEACSEYFKNKL